MGGVGGENRVCRADRLWDGSEPMCSKWEGRGGIWDGSEPICSKWEGRGG